MQFSMFDGSSEFKINKPIRLIELFAGYGSQHLALKYLGANSESYKICEWAVKSIQAYKDIHFSNDDTDYSKDFTKEQLVELLTTKGISANYNEPMTYEQIKRLGESKIRQIYNNIIATHNLVNIQQAHAEDFEIVDTDKYCYIMTYSFPCQDLSKAGLGKGMAKDSGTRSGMLWEVERILDECNGNLPQVLLMENVPDVVGTNNVKHFASWLAKLESLGYHCYWQVLNAKDYGVPQNRERCFMVSILGDYYYDFPEPIKLEKRLKDLLEDEVDEKYYLSDKMVNYFENHSEECKEKGTGFRFTPQEKENANIGRAITTRAGGRMDDNFIKIKGKEFKITEDTDNYIQWHTDGLLDSECRAWKDNKEMGTLTCKGNNKVYENLKTKLCNELISSGKVKENDIIRHSYTNNRLNNGDKNMGRIENHEGLSPTLDTRCDCLGVVNNYRIRKLTPKECFRLMGVKDEDFEKIAKNQSNASLYHLAGDSIVVNVLMAIFEKIL